MFKKTAMILAVSLYYFSAGAETLVVQGPRNKDDTRPTYFKKLLQLALDKTEDKYGKATVKYSDVFANQNRNIKDISKNRRIKVIWTMTSKKREGIKGLMPVRIPLLKGLLGHRVCLINKKNTGKFKNVKSISDFKKFSIGQGPGWPDVNILRANKLNVNTGSKYKGLFGMLKRGRFDCFARGVNEPWAELKKFGAGKLVVDKHIVFRYKSPIYFFVHESNKKLAQRISEGLHIAIEDKSFEKHFYKYNKDFIDKAGLKKRVIIDLKNPTLPKETPVDNKKLWLKL